ncbi:MAG: hypothetical protein ACRC2T_20115 [Thermoguttaceae bacterium]
MTAISSLFFSRSSISNDYSGVKQPLTRASSADDLQDAFTKSPTLFRDMPVYKRPINMNSASQNNEFSSKILFRLPAGSNGKNAPTHQLLAGWGLGINLNDAFEFKEEISEFEFYDIDDIKLRMALDDQKINSKINDVLKLNGITLGAFEKFDFSVNQDGQVKLKDSNLDPEKKDAIEKVLNQNSSIGQDLLLSQAQRNTFERFTNSKYQDGDTVQHDSVADRVILDSVLKNDYGISLRDLRLGGNDVLDGIAFEDLRPGESDALKGVKSIEGSDGGVIDQIRKDNPALYAKISEILGSNNSESKSDFSFDFSYMNGAVIYPGEADPNRVFNNNENDLSGLCTLLGVEKVSNVASLRETLRSSIEQESRELAASLAPLMKKAGLDNLTRQITFAEDKNGNIVALGNIRPDKKKALEKLINDDPDIAERIKTQKAKMDIAEELQKEGQSNGRTVGLFDFTSDKLASARKQLVGDYIRRNSGLSINDIVSQHDAETGNVSFLVRDSGGNESASEKLNELLSDFKGLQHELKYFIDEKTCRKGIIS